VRWCGHAGRICLWDGAATPVSTSRPHLSLRASSPEGTRVKAVQTLILASRHEGGRALLPQTARTEIAAAMLTLAAGSHPWPPQTDLLLVRPTARGLAWQRSTPPGPATAAAAYMHNRDGDPLTAARLYAVAARSAPRLPNATTSRDRPQGSTRTAQLSAGLGIHRPDRDRPADVGWSSCWGRLA
jgi:hypothetical protein